MRVFDDRSCQLGEGPLWEPERERLYWFDITGRRLLSRDAEGSGEWHLPELHSAAARLDADHLLLASESGLWRFSLSDGRRERLAPLEADRPGTRSNDGRADPWGGFWISTMGKAAEAGAGAIWRWYGGELRRLFSGLTIPNAIAFPPGGGFATFCDTPRRQLLRVPLDASSGWPAGRATPWLDLEPEGLNPDGAVFDARGRLWLAEWGAARIAVYDRDGRRLSDHRLPVPHVSCPAFGGPDLSQLFCTTAREGLSSAERQKAPLSGQTFCCDTNSRGQEEHRVRLPASLLR